MDYPKLIVSNQKDQSISIQRVNMFSLTANSCFYSFYKYHIYTERNFPLLSIGPVYFHFKGCWVVLLIFIKILIEHSVSKQQRF